MASGTGLPATVPGSQNSGEPSVPKQKNTCSTHPCLPKITASGTTEKIRALPAEDSSASESDRAREATQRERERESERERERERDRGREGAGEGKGSAAYVRMLSIGCQVGPSSFLSLVGVFLSFFFVSSDLSCRAP